MTEAWCGHPCSASTISRLNASLAGVRRRVAARRLDEAAPSRGWDARDAKGRRDGVIQTQAGVGAIGITKDGRRCGRGVALSHRASRASETSVLTGRTVARARVAARRRAGAPDGARRPRVVRLVPHPARCRRRVRARCADTHAGWLDDHRSRNRDCLTAPQQHLRQTAASTTAASALPRPVHHVTSTTFLGSCSGRSRGGRGAVPGRRAPRAREGGGLRRRCRPPAPPVALCVAGGDGVAGAAAAPGSRAVGRRWAWRRAGRAPGDRRLITG